MSAKKQKIIKITNEGLKNNYIENYSDNQNWTPELFSKLANIEIKSKTKEELVFDITGVDPTIVNTLRRIMIAEIPTMAIETVIINQNTSIIPDEVLAHRLGLTPLVSDLESIEGLVMPEDCDCDSEKGEYCPKCSVSFSLNESGPKVVYSRDLKSCGDSKIKPVYDTIPLLDLEKNQEVELEAVAKLGIGKDHAKWMPTTVCVYKQYPEITFNENEDIPYAAADACPKGVLVANKEEGRIEITDVENCSLCKSCVRKAKELGSRYIKIGYRENDFIFNNIVYESHNLILNKLLKSIHSMNML